jgi:hypothetical protein
MTIAVIMHNMIIENERGAEEDDFDYDQDGGEVLSPDDYHCGPLVLSDLLRIHSVTEPSKL